MEDDLSEEEWAARQPTGAVIVWAFAFGIIFLGFVVALVAC